MFYDPYIKNLKLKMIDETNEKLAEITGVEPSYLYLLRLDPGNLKLVKRLMKNDKINREIHIYIYQPELHHELELTSGDALRALLRKDIIHTTQTHFCRSEYIYEYGFTIYIHFNATDEPVIIDENGSKATKRRLTRRHNLEKLLLAGEFGRID